MFSGQNYSELEKLAVWVKAFPIPGYDPNIYRRDRFGTVIRYSDYGNLNSLYGWQIDHTYPSSKGGSNSYPNLEPLNWKNNIAKGVRII